MAPPCPVDVAGTTVPVREPTASEAITPSHSFRLRGGDLTAGGSSGSPFAIRSSLSHRLATLREQNQEGDVSEDSEVVSPSAAGAAVRRLSTAAEGDEEEAGVEQTAQSPIEKSEAAESEEGSEPAEEEVVEEVEEEAAEPAGGEAEEEDEELWPAAREAAVEEQAAEAPVKAEKSERSLPPPEPSAPQTQAPAGEQTCIWYPTRAGLVLGSHAVLYLAPCLPCMRVLQLRPMKQIAWLRLV